MPFVAVKCPQCGGDLQLNNEMESGFCMYCGTKIVVQESIRAVRIDNTHMVDAWMKNGDLAAESGNTAEAYVNYSKILEVQPENYLALFKKGKAAGWQSTLDKERITEAAVCFVKAIELAPGVEKEVIKAASADEMRMLTLAYISLRADIFMKWPDREETENFEKDMQIIETAVDYLCQNGDAQVEGYKKPIAEIINNAVVHAWHGKILPDYQGNENHPNRYEYDRFIEQEGYCITLTEYAIGLYDEDNEQDIQMYENCISYEKAAIESCAWDYSLTHYEKSWFKVYELATTAKQWRKAGINLYNKKIAELRTKIREGDEAEKQRKNLLAKEEAKKRIDEYWSLHAQERACLVSEKKDLCDQLAPLELRREAFLKPFLDVKTELEERIAQYKNKQSRLGIFKGKEKKVLQVLIEETRQELDAKRCKLEESLRPIIARIENLQTQVNEIDAEFTKER